MDYAQPQDFKRKQEGSLTLQIYTVETGTPSNNVNWTQFAIGVEYLAFVFSPPLKTKEKYRGSPTSMISTSTVQ